MQFRHHLLTITAVITGASTIAMADSFNIGDTDVDLTLLSVGPSRAVTAYYDDGTDIFNRTVTGGQLIWTGGVRAFCVQLLENIRVGQTRPFDVVSIEDVPEAPPQPGPMGAARAALISDLYARHYDDVISSTGTMAANKSAAFAMLIWEITHQDSDGTTAAAILLDLDLSTGNARFNSNSATNDFASTWLANLGGGSSTPDFLTYNGLVGLTDPETQDYIAVVPGPAGLVAAIGLAGIRRRRRRH